MNEIHISDLSKRYQFQWVIRNISYSFSGSKMYGVGGRNGSGKSTLLQILSGYLSPSSGSIIYSVSHRNVSASNVFKEVSLVGPYTDVINEFTLQEMFHFHFKFKQPFNGLTFQQFEEIIELQKQGNKCLNHFSSGMKQKIQLALALLSKTPFLFLDEPTSFLDSGAKKWFSEMLDAYAKDRLTIISSNDPFDLGHCSEVLLLD
jgi:ABC-type multidrug transport system ATPase subunit